MDTQKSGLSQRKQTTLVDVCNTDATLLNEEESWQTAVLNHPLILFSPVQILLSRPDMVKPTSQVQRVEPRKWVQWEGRTEAKGEEVVGENGRAVGEEVKGGDMTEEDAERAAETGKDEEDEERAGGEKEGRELPVLLKPEKQKKISWLKIYRFYRNIFAKIQRYNI